MFCAESMLYVVKSFDKMFANNGRNLPIPNLCSHIISQTSAISWQNDMCHSLASRSRFKEFCLQVKTNEADQWRTVDSVNDNTEMQTDRLLAEPVDARYVRLYITKPDQSEGFAARIYEFEVY